MSSKKTAFRPEDIPGCVYSWSAEDGVLRDELEWGPPDAGGLLLGQRTERHLTTEEIAAKERARARATTENDPLFNGHASMRFGEE